MMPSGMPEHRWSPTATRPDLTIPVAHGEETIEVPVEVAAWEDFRAFLPLLKDDQGRHLTRPWHITEWCDLMQTERLFCLMAARDHAKTWTVLAYIAWRLWRHNRGRNGKLLPGHPDGNFKCLYFSSIMPQAVERVERLQQFLMDNEELFGDVLPAAALGEVQMDRSSREVWSKTHFRLRNGAEVYAKSIGSSVRGHHPELTVADDIVEEKNSTTELQRARVWRFLIGAIVPMAGPTGQLLVLGTPQHQADALHRVRHAPNFKWKKYRAVDFERGHALWPQRYSLSYLLDLQKTDPLLFSREYQMDPRDDLSSIFPYSLTAGPVEAGKGHRWLRPWRHTMHDDGDIIIGGGDVALSETAGADYTVYIVAVYNRYSQKRRMLWAERVKGLTFDQQVTLMRDLCRDFGVQVFVVEQNNFQKWLIQHLRKYPETATSVFGHTTGIERQRLDEGLPGMKLVLENGLWEWPTEPREADDFIGTMRAEMSAFGWSEGKLGGVGEHDDTVSAFWMTERAVRLVSEYFGAPDDIVEMEDIGIERVSIGADY